MALGTGLLIGSVSFELVDEALKTRTVAWVALLVLVGAAAFTFGNIVAATGDAVAATLLVRRNARTAATSTTATEPRILGAALVHRVPRLRAYDGARVGAEVEALTVAQQVETAQFLPSAAGGELTGELVARGAPSCSGRPRPFGPRQRPQEAAYGRWLDQTSASEQARIDRVHGALGVVPSPLWLMLFLIFGVIVTYMLFFADSGERAVVQALLMGSVVTTIVAMLLLLRFFDHPYEPGVGSLRPVAMERTMVILDQELRVTGQSDLAPCDASGSSSAP